MRNYFLTHLTYIMSKPKVVPFWCETILISFRANESSHSQFLTRCRHLNLYVLQMELPFVPHLTHKPVPPRQWSLHKGHSASQPPRPTDSRALLDPSLSFTSTSNPTTTSILPTPNLVSASWPDHLKTASLHGSQRELLKAQIRPCPLPA